MRAKLFGAFLLGTTAFYPAQARAMPIILPFIGGLISAIGAPTIGGLVAGGAAGIGSGAFISGFTFGSSLFGGGFLVNAALSIGLSVLAAMLRPRPQVPDPGQRVVNLRQPISFMEFGYGRVRKGGPVYIWQAKEGARFYGILLAAREISGFAGRFLDEREPDSIEAVTDKVLPQNKFKDMKLQEFTGAPGQAAPTLLLDNFVEWTSAHDLEGFAHAVMYVENVKPDDFSKVFPSGREPVYTGLLDMFKIYDPRDVAQDENDPTTWTFSNNGALVIADWVVSRDGLGRSVNWDKVAIQADRADLDVTDRDGNIRKKWQLAGTYSSADERETVRANMGVACDAFFYEDDDGTVGFYLGGYDEPDVTVTDEDIIRISYSEGQAGTEIKNAQVVSYTEPEQGYREAASSPYIVDDPSEAYSEDALNVFWIPNHNQAVRVAKRLLLTSRAQYKISAILKYNGIRLKTKRFFRLQHSEFDDIDIVCEIDKLSRNDDGITFTVEAHTVTAADFEFNAVVEEPEKPKRNSIVADDDVPEPAGITATVEIMAGVPTVLVDWDDPPRESILNQVRYREHDGPGDWFQISVPIGQSYQRIDALSDNAEYDIQVRALTPGGRASKWVPNNAGDEDDPTLSVTILIDPTAPLTLASLATVGSMGRASVTFATASGDAHVRTVGIYRVATGGAAPTAADTPLALVLASAGSTFTYTDGDGTITNMLVNGDGGGSAPPTLNTGWTNTPAGKFSHSATTGSFLLWPSITITAAGVYRLGVTIDTVSGSGVLSPRFSGSVNETWTTTYATTGIKRQTYTAVNGNTAFGLGINTNGVIQIDDVVLFLQTAACIPQAIYDYYAIPFNQSGIDGPVSGPVTANVI